MIDRKPRFNPMQAIDAPKPKVGKKIKTWRFPEGERLDFPSIQNMSRIPAIVKRLIPSLRAAYLDSKADVLSLVFVGTSGALMAYEIARQLDFTVQLVQVRKESEPTHRSTVTESYHVPRDTTRVTFFVDDFISMGKTVIRAVEVLDLHEGITLDGVIVSGSQTASSLPEAVTRSVRYLISAAKES